MHFWPIFGPKICFFLRYTPTTPLFGLGRTRLDGIISPPYPEVTLDTFSFWVGGRSAARRAVLQPRLPKVAFFGVKNAVFRPETHFSETSSKKIVPIVTGHQKDNSFVLTHCMAGLWGAAGSIFGPKLTLKTVFFHATPCSTHFWGSDGLHSMGS